MKCTIGYTAAIATIFAASAFAERVVHTAHLQVDADRADVDRTQRALNAAGNIALQAVEGAVAAPVYNGGKSLLRGTSNKVRGLFRKAEKDLNEKAAKEKKDASLHQAEGDVEGVAGEATGSEEQQADADKKKTEATAEKKIGETEEEGGKLAGKAANKLTNAISTARAEFVGDGAIGGGLYGLTEEVVDAFAPRDFTDNFRGSSDPHYYSQNVGRGLGRAAFTGASAKFVKGGKYFDTVKQAALPNMAIGVLDGFARSKLRNAKVEEVEA